jgi:hypothetical protein
MCVLYVCYMYIICMLYVCYMYNICMLYVCYMYIICMLYVCSTFSLPEHMTTSLGILDILCGENRL